MKQLKLLFLTTTFLFSSFTFVAEGGICASKPIKAEEELNPEATDETTVSGGRAADAVAEAAAAVGQSDQDKRNMLRVLSRSLNVFAPDAKKLLAASVLGEQPEAPQAAEENANQVTVSVENVGSGIIIIPALEINPDDTIGSLREAILSCSTSLGVTLFLGHGGTELSDNNVTLRDAGVKDGSTIVVVQITLELYLARQKEAMRALYQLLPDRAKVAALARLNNHPSTWLGVEDASPEGFILKLDLSCSQLTGEIPTELGLLTKLQTLSLSQNELTGQIPSELGQLTRLQYLSLAYNHLTGAIPRELGLLTKLRNLFLRWNQLTGQIPSELGLLTELGNLDLCWNQLTGPIPRELGELTKLAILTLSQNQLTGPTPPALIRRGVRVFR
jgi:hypothetical protein